jgi:hypothetical protein
VFVILTDGLRPDAVTSDRMPHLRGLAAAHTSAVHASTVRPSTTLAALATVVTGLSPASHGLVESRLGLALVGQLARLTPLPRTLRRSGIESRIIASALTPLERTVVRALTTAAAPAVAARSWC